MSDSDELKAKKELVLDTILNICLKKKNLPLPKVSFGFEESTSFSNSDQGALHIGIFDLMKSDTALESVVAHELGHLFRRDDRNDLIRSVALDCIQFVGACYLGLGTLTALNTCMWFGRGLGKSFQEKEADRFAMESLDQGPEKMTASLRGDLRLSMLEGRGYTMREQLLFDACMSEMSGKGLDGHHPTEHQRMTWAMQRVKDDGSKTTSAAKEWFRFLSTPFYGDMDLVEAGMKDS